MKKNYSKLTVSPLGVTMQGSLLSASAIKGATVQSVGQEVGVAYNLSATDGIDTNTGKTFAHEWEEGSGL